MRDWKLTHKVLSTNLKEITFLRFVPFPTRLYLSAPKLQSKSLKKEKMALFSTSVRCQVP